MTDLQKTNKGQEKSGFLTLPFDDRQFKSFIKGLLGNPQKITKRKRGVFDLNIDDLKNFHELINQRVSQQNQSSLLQFEAEIYYNDQSSVSLSTYEELTTYNEVKPVTSTQVRLKWNYLIKFEDKEVPEKQTIELQIATSFMEDVELDEIGPMFFPWSNSGTFYLVIEHTARSWGSDIENLLSNQIDTLLKPKQPIRGFIRKKRALIGILSGILFFISSTIGVYISNLRFNTAETQKINDFLDANSNLVDAKIDYILQYIALNSQNLLLIKSISFLLVALFVAIVMSITITTFAKNYPKSFLLLTKNSEEHKQEQLKKSKHKHIYFVSAFVLNILTGLITAYLFVMFTSN